MQVMNPLGKYVVFGISEMKMYEKQRSVDTIYGIGNNNKFWPWRQDICKRDRVDLNRFMMNKSEYEVDILYDCDSQMLTICVVGCPHDDNNAWIMVDSKLKGVGFVPHFEFEGCLNGPKLRVCKIPVEWYGKSKQITLPMRIID